MGDSGEGLVDAEARIAERRDEREEERRRAAAPRIADPERVREIQSLKLARTEMARQLGVTAHATRREQLEQALAEISRRLTALEA